MGPKGPDLTRCFQKNTHIQKEKPMKQYEITFCAPIDDEDRFFIARALAEGKTAYDAAPKAYELLKDKYPEIKPGDWLSIQTHSSLDLSSPIEAPCLPRS